MSTISTRRQVRQVESAPVDAAARARAAALAAGLSQLLGAAAKAVFQTVKSRPARLAAAGLPPIEREKVGALLDLGQAPAALGQGARLEECARAVLAAPTAVEARGGRQRLTVLLADSRREALAASVALCCRQAALDMGMTPIGEETAGLPLRVATADDTGRAIVSEIRGTPEGALTLESEVVGVTDGSCAGMLEQYEKLLEERGVQSEEPRRRPTGGILMTQAARAFAGARLRRSMTAPVLPAVKRRVAVKRETQRVR